jgi:hypothetical protein
LSGCPERSRNHAHISLLDHPIPGPWIAEHDRPRLRLAAHAPPARPGRAQLLVEIERDLPTAHAVRPARAGDDRSRNPDVAYRTTRVARPSALSWMSPPSAPPSASTGTAQPSTERSS